MYDLINRLISESKESEIPDSLRKDRQLQINHQIYMKVYTNRFSPFVKI
jgi:hypothetical protein